jgi:hypothetical protein
VPDIDITTDDKPKPDATTGQAIPAPPGLPATSTGISPPPPMFSPSSPSTTALPFAGGGFPQPTYQDYIARQEQLLEQRAAITKQTEDALQQAIIQRQGLMAQGISPTREPQFYNVKPPPQQKFMDPLQAFANPLVMLTVLGSLAVRRGGGLAAMKAATEAINGFHKGDQEAMAQNLENWKQSTDAVIKQNNIELNRYNAALKTTEHKVSERQAKLEAIAASTGDEVKLAALRQGNIDGFLGLLDQQRQHTEKMEELQLRYGLGPSGEPDKAAIEQYYQSGEYPKNMGKGIQGAMEARRIRQVAEEQHPDDPPSNWPRRWQVFKARGQAFAAGAKKLEERAAGMDLVEEETATLIPRVRELVSKVDRTRFPDLNALIVAGKTKTGNEDEIALGVAVESLIPVYARLLKPTGQVGVTDTNRAHGILDARWATGQMLRALDQMELERSSARNALEHAKQRYYKEFVVPSDQDLMPTTTGVGGTAAPASGGRGPGAAPTITGLQKLPKVPTDGSADKQSQLLKEGFRLAPDGNYYREIPNQPGKYERAVVR